MCKKCEEYYKRYRCGKNIGEGECDCPKCQGLCEDGLEKLAGAVVDEVEALQDIEGGEHLMDAILDSFEECAEDD